MLINSPAELTITSFIFYNYQTIYQVNILNETSKQSYDA